MPAMGIVVYAVVLLGAWVVFAGTVHVLSTLTGAAVVTLSMVLFHRGISGGWLPGSREPYTGPLRPRRVLYALAFLPIFLGKIFVSGLIIARFALTPGVSFWPGIVKTQGGLPSIGATTILANFITLTPGTLTLDYDARSDTLYIHWMDVSEYEAQDIDEQVTSNMRPWVREISGW